MVLCKLPTRLLAPAVTHTNQHSKDQCEETRFIPQRREHFGPPPCLLTGPLGQMRGAYLWPMARRDLAMMEARPALVLQAAARFGKEPLLLLQESVETPLSLLTRRRIAPVRHQRCARGPGRRRHRRSKGLHLMKPAAHPPRPGPQAIDRCAQAWGPIGGAGHGSREPALAQVPQPLEATLLAFAVSWRQAQPHCAPIDAHPPDTEEPRLAPPAP